ncbi:MAG: hypothetical protein KF823_12860 [Xanthomonadales bacterium]|nr:hypothetical protein [Xanthomonadales bacterium]
MDLALFDFDGTITHRETMPDFLRAAVRPARLAVGKLLFAPLVLGSKTMRNAGCPGDHERKAR